MAPFVRYGRAVAQAIAVFVAAGLVTALLYAQTLRYGFHYDDYHFVRPFSAGEVWQAFRGSWDATGIEVAFYRPLMILVGGRIRLARLPVRHQIQFTRTPVVVVLEEGGRTLDRMKLTDGEWHVLQAPLRPSGLPALTRMHRLRLAVDRTWRPLDVIPASTDARVFGVQLGEIEVR